MNHKTTKPLKDVLDEFTHIGNCFYNGNHSDNVLNIFSELEPEDQRALLVGVFHVYSVMEQGVLPESFTKSIADLNGENVVVDNKKKSDISVDPAALNTKSMIQLKVWIFKASVIFLFIFFFGLVALIFAFSQDTNTPGQVSGFIKILGMLFK